jgi:hypothetical protein
LPVEIPDAAPAGTAGLSTGLLTHGWLAVGYMTALLSKIIDSPLFSHCKERL